MITPSIIYSCYVTRSFSGEQFVPEHIFSFQLSGSLTINDGNKEYIIREGKYRFTKRNRLAKFIKLPPEKGEFKSISICLNQDLLQKISREYGYAAEPVAKGDAIIELKPNALFDSYFQSLAPYYNLSGKENEELVSVKSKEAVLLLLRTNPDLKNVLFDFSEPGKIDLEAFMNRNFQFNVSMQRFAYLTGRSLTTFKRDFEKIFQISPGRWLLQRRLQEAHYLIEKKGQKPSDVYLEVGFEDLSHFSFAFKKAYRVAPSQLAGN